MSFDEGAISHRLARLGRVRAAAWAAACAERSLPHYRGFDVAACRETESVLRGCLDRLWSDLRSGNSTSSVGPEDVAVCERVASSWSDANKDDDWVPNQTIAEDIAVAVACAIRGFVEDDTKKFTLSGRRAYELRIALAELVADNDDNGISARFDYADEPQVENERSLQERDLVALETAGTSAAGVAGVYRLLRGERGERPLEEADDAASRADGIR